MDNDLPKLREEIELSSTGDGQWTLYDKATEKYYRLNQHSFTILSSLHRASDKEELLTLVSREIECTMDDIDDVITFCAKNFLVQVPNGEGIEKLIHVNKQVSGTTWYTKLIHGYLFFKIHLFNPDHFLKRTQKLMNIFYTAPFAWAMTLFFVINLIFVFNRFSEFLSTFVNITSLEGLVYIAVSVIIVKTFHEFGHAYTARRAGCKVPSMGIALMVFYPMPYTDTTDAWRLPKKLRMRIALAGIKTEMIIASFMMTAWLWLPEGMLKSLSFYIISISMISTLAINLTPFMRYDGYYALSDYVGIENLHSRSFLQAKAFVKKFLWGIDVDVEVFEPKKKSLLILFAFWTWIYRVILFGGIAYLVYAHTFKALGIILFWIEIWYFVLLPVVKEVKEWYALRSQIRFNLYSFAGWGVVAGLCYLLFLPYASVVRLPAVLDSDVTTFIYAEYDSQVIYIHPEGAIKKGELIMSAHSVENDLERQTAQRKMELFQKQASTAFVSQETLANSNKYLQSLQGESAKINVANSIRGNMNIYAANDGILLYEQKLSTGQFVGSTQKVARIIDPKTAVIKGYVKDVDLFEIQQGKKGEFFDFVTLDRFEVKIDKIENTPIDLLKEPLLNSNYQGSIAVEKENIPQRPMYEVKLSPLDKKSGENVYYQRSGEVSIVITHSSVFERLVNETLSFFIKESSF